MPSIQQIIVPLLSVNDTSLTVVDICFAQGALVKKGDVLLVFETSKTTYDVIADTNGYIDYTCVVNEEYTVNEVVANIYSAANEVVIIQQTSNANKVVEHINTSAPSIKSSWQGQTLFSDAAIQLMQLNDISTTFFEGKDFVTKKDVEAVLGINSEIHHTANAKVNVAKKNDVVKIDNTKVIVEKLTLNKKREIEYLSAVQATGLTSTINVVVETEGIFVHINQSLQVLKNTLLPVIMYEAARLLQKYKVLNAYYTGQSIAYYNTINIGFAIDIDKGLKVLCIPTTNTKSIQEIESSILELSNKYIDDVLQVSDVTDVGFTITDLSAETVAFFRPLVNMMNSAILGIAAIDEKLNRCILSVTFDHRVTEGKLVAQFLNELKRRLESYKAKNMVANTQHIICFKCFKHLSDDLSDVGFAKCITPKGDEAFICQSCLKGF